MQVGELSVGASPWPHGAKGGDGSLWGVGKVLIECFFLLWETKKIGDEFRGLKTVPLALDGGRLVCKPHVEHAQATANEQ